MASNSPNKTRVKHLWQLMTYSEWHNLEAKLCEYDPRSRQMFREEITAFQKKLKGSQDKEALAKLAKIQKAIQICSRIAQRTPDTSKMSNNRPSQQLKL